MNPIDKNIHSLYKKRFEGSLEQKNKVWQTLCSSFFQKYIKEDWDVADIGAGYCEFINNIKAGNKYAIDINEDTAKYANSDVQVLNCKHNNLTPLPDSSLDAVFTSNFLEHLQSRRKVIKILSEAFRVLREGGKIMVLQPNIKYAYKEYWDFFDHYIPLSDKSLVEALQLAGFRIELLIPRFLPYSLKNNFPTSRFLIRLYLKIPLIWKLMGKQVFIIGRKEGNRI